MAKASPSKSKTTTTRAKRATKTVAASKAKTASKTAKNKTAKVAPPRETVKTLRDHVDSINSRLKRANTLTRNSVKSLQTSFEVLEKRVSGTSYVDQDALNAKVGQLSHHLTYAIEKTRQDIKADLQQAVSTQDINEISDALVRARVRLDETELSQAESLTKVNRHIANLAKAIDDRIREEYSDRQHSLRLMADKVDTQHAKVNLRLNKIEDASADAIRQLGEKIVELNTQAQTKADKNSDVIREKVTDIGTKTQRSVDELKRKLERRMESMEEAQKNLDSYADRMISTINNRLDSLEYGLVNAVPSTPEGEETSDAKVITLAREEDAFSPTEPPVATSDGLATPQPAPTVPLTPTGNSIVPDAFGPVEYVPEPYVPPAAYPQAEPYNTPEPPQQMAAGYGQVVQSAPQPAHPVFTGPANNPVGISDVDLPYENPAYAESEPDTKNRPGEVRTKIKKPKSRNSSGGSSKTLKVAGLAIILAGLGYVGMKTFTGRNDTPLSSAPPIERVSTTPQSSSGPLVQAVPADISTSPTVGDYADNRGAVIDPTGQPEVPTETSKTLEAAAATGDPIAQFQLGIVYLDSGRASDGVELIRASANQNQPAAQYRLAKLYETGQGVTADPDMARQLTERAARNGNRIAMHDLALYYAEGRGGVKTNITTAASWFEKAAERGVVDSQFNLGVLFESGQGVPRNVIDAYVWYSIASNQGDQFAKERQTILKGQISAEEIAQAESRVARFTPTKIDEAANGVFRNVSWTISENASTGPSPTMVKDVQQLLADLGYEVGTPDGAMGPNTREAIVEFQKSVGLVETGEVTTALIDRLEIAAGT